MRITIAYACLLTSVCLASAAHAQPASVAMTLHPGDKIEFRPNEDHRVRLGELPNGRTTSYAELKRLLELPADILALCDGDTDVESGDPDVCDIPTENTFTAVVRADADLAAGSVFNFTCGEHPPMVTRPFEIVVPSTPLDPRSFVIDTDNFTWRLSLAISG